MNAVAETLAAARARVARSGGPNRFVEALEAGRVPRERLGWLAGELSGLVESDRRAFALLASRFPAGPAGELYLAMAQGEGEALALLGEFTAALGPDGRDLSAYEPRPLAQAYPAYLTRCALYGARADVALALLVNAPGSGEVYRRVARALAERYGFEEKALGHFLYFAETPPELLDLASRALAAGLAGGDDPVAAVRCAWTVHALEEAFWGCLAEGLDDGTDGPRSSTIQGDGQ
ncbi:transcriptional regulator [Streptomyces sp. NPDC004539]|uniref:transcriptional regulator n=1 Tax=Streptomyces sp. NPDC004539 TaxID=3154280 RepID=UPI0033A2CD7A